MDHTILPTWSQHPAILRLPAVLSRTGLSRSTIYQWMKERRFPQSITLGIKAVGWSESDISNWITERIAEGSERGVQQ
jgi:prophage regulatory protein